MPSRSLTDCPTCNDVSGFYGINVGSTDDSPSYKGITTLKFHENDFYLESGLTDTDRVHVNLRSRLSNINESGGYINVLADVRPNTDGTRNLGGPKNRFNKIRGKELHIRGGSGPESSNITGNFVGYTKPGSTNSTAAFEVNGQGAFAGGYTSSTTLFGSSNRARVRAGASGSFAFGASIAGSFSDSNNLSYMRSSGLGSVAMGAVRSTAGSSSSRMYSTGIGSFVLGSVVSKNLMQASANGAFAMGYSAASTYGRIRASATGAFAMGCISTGSSGYITASGAGSFALGNALGASTITSTVAGSFAMGRATGGSNITASGFGSLAVGYATFFLTPIVASAANSVQFGEGTNATANSVQIGSARIRLFGNTGGSNAGGITMTGPLDHDGSSVGFFSHAPVTQRSDFFYLSVPGTPTTDGALATVSGSGADGDINNNFAEVAAKLNRLRNALRDYGLLG